MADPVQNRYTLTTETMLTLASDKKRSRLHRAHAAILTGPLKQLQDETALTGPLSLGKINTVLFLQSSHNIQLQVSDADGGTVTLPVGKFFEAYFSAENVVLLPISANTHVTAFFY